MEDLSLATIVAKLEVQHQYTRDALNEIKTTIEKEFEISRKEREDIRLELSQVKGSLEIVRKIGNVALSLALSLAAVLGGIILKSILGG